MPVKIAVCDDMLPEREMIVSLVREWQKQSGTEVELSEFPTAEAFLFAYEDEKFQIVLLDIEMPGMNGVELAKRLRAQSKLVQIVFITGYFAYIEEGYEVAALHYLLKPVDREKLFRVLDRAAEKLETDGRTILLETAGETVLLPIYEIRYIEVMKNYITIHAARPYTLKKTLKEFETELDDRFLRVGRSCIVNIRCIARVTHTEVYLRDGEAVPIPRSAYEKVNRAVIGMKR